MSRPSGHAAGSPPMTSLILGTTARLIVPVLLLFSIFLLLRGHNEPGGGFAGGLVAAAGFTLVAVARDPATARRILAVDPLQVVGVGILLAVIAAGTGKLLGDPLLTARWIELTLPGDTVVELGTPILFDVGVYLVVLGTTLGIVLALVEDQGDEGLGDLRPRSSDAERG